MPYSVSPFLREKTVRAEPTMYCGTRMPKSLAVDRCPSSCQAIENSRPTTKTTMPRIIIRAVMHAPPR